MCRVSLDLFPQPPDGNIHGGHVGAHIAVVPHYVGDDVRTVDVTVRRLREKIEADPANPAYILTRRGAGYYFSVYRGDCVPPLDSPSPVTSVTGERRPRRLGQGIFATYTPRRK